MSKSWLVNAYKWSLRTTAAIITLIAIYWWYKSGFKDASLFLIFSASFPLFYLSNFTLEQEERDRKYPIGLIIPKVFFFFGFSVLIYVTTIIFWGANLPGFILTAILFYTSSRLFLRDLDRWRKTTG